MKRRLKTIVPKTYSPEEVTALVTRGHAAKFALHQATLDMNEILERFRELCCVRFSIGASVRLSDGAALSFRPGVLKFAGALLVGYDTATNTSRRTRLKVIEAMPALWDQLVSSNG